MKHTSIERELDERDRCMIQTVGVSMEPILHNRHTTVVLEKVKAPLRRGDVVLFRRAVADASAAPCEYVLHRIIGVRGDEYRIRGDNCLQTDSCRKEQILGVMVGFFNGEHYTNCGADRAYIRYTKTIGLRYVGRLLRAVCAKIIRYAQRQTARARHG